MVSRPSQNERDLAAAIAESQYLLDRWQFTVSDRGVLCLTPNPLGITPDAATQLFRRLYSCCDSGFPSIVLIDFRRLPPIDGPRPGFINAARRFARELNYECRLVGGADGRFSAMYFYRSTR